MQALILAAGKGTRLAPLTDHLPKCLVPIHGKAVLDYQREALKKIGVEKITIVTGHEADKIKAHAHKDSNLDCLFNPEYARANIIHSFGLALDKRDFNQTLLVMAGDVIFESQVLENLVKGGTDDQVRLCIQKKTCGTEEVKVSVNNDRITRLGKDLTQNIYGEFLGVFKIGKEALGPVKKATHDILSRGLKQSYLFNMLNQLIDEKPDRVTGYDIGSSLWEEIDFPEDIDRATAKIKPC